MNVEKQKLLVSYLMSDSDLYARCSAILDTNYFDPEVRHSVHFIQEHYDKYRALPSSDQVRVETGNSFEQKPLTKSESSYAVIEIEKYCRNKAMEKAILASPKLMDKDDFDTIHKNIKEAMEVSVSRDIGIDYFENPIERLQRMMLYNAKMSTGFRDLDALLDGGPSRKELLLYMGGSGAGKSVHMSNLGVNFMKQKYNVVYITLELAEDVVSKRHDGITTNIAQKEIFEKMTKVASELERMRASCGQLHVKRMPESTTNANHIRAYLKEFELAKGFMPDVVIVDYMDLMASNQKISAENLFVKDKYIAEELRSIASEYNLLMVSASQMNRSAIGADDIDQSKIAGGLSKINTCDNLIAIIHTDAMKAAGECMLKMVKTRNSSGVGQFVMLRWNPNTLKISDLEGKADRLEFVTNKDKKQDKKKDLLDLINV